MRIVFLDIDGVLAPFNFSPSAEYRRVCHDILPPRGCLEFDRNCVAELNLICSAGKASIVVSSSWRNHIQDVDVMRAMMQEQGVNAPVAGMTPIASGEWESHDRGDEVKHFLEPLDVESFVILDDTDMGWDGLEDRWVKTRCLVGITRADAKRAIEILNSPILIEGKRS